MASTADCKKLLEQSAAEFGYSAKAVWKRTRKYKEDGVELRTFESNNGDRVTISEAASGQLTIEFVFVNSALPDSVRATLSKEKLIYGIVKAYLDCEPDTLSQFSGSNELTEVGFERMKKYVVTGDPSTLEDIHKHLRLKQHSHFLHQIARDLELTNQDNFVRDISSDSVGVIYDKENIEADFIDHDEMTFLKIIMGGDWEWPVFAFVYWSEVEQRAKGFFPTGDGNVYNVDCKCAYGSEHECDLTEEEQEKYELIVQEIITKTGPELEEKAMKIGLEQLNTHIFQESALPIYNPPVKAK